MIENAIKKEFLFKVKDNHYKEALGMEYKLKLPQLESELAQRKMEYEVKEGELEERKEKL